MTNVNEIEERVHFQSAQWAHSFKVDGELGGPIALAQINRKTFRLDSRIDYVGPTTGLEGRIDAETLREIRYVTPEHLATGTDLTSVPGPLRWFTGRYGSHTPAALIHDRFIGGEQPGTMNDQYADRYFRFMLQATGVRWLKRWLMWAAVALRSRLAARGVRRFSVIVWIAAAIIGSSTLVIGLLDRDWLLVSAALFAPVLFAGLWWRQYGAGLVMAYSAPWLLPPALFAAVTYGFYLLIEFAAKLVLSEERAGTDTFRLQG